ncbi:hypothetical protein T10_575 [Trichinella papuae]|uniref:Cyclin-dependent kinase 2-interacting protein n=1 Tax=Trichinella papuae TaxID=268474 RepID=A0A0V1MJD4_9BILA|nr:hypothetical protein T10_575 [Trichinella papuae]
MTTASLRRGFCNICAKSYNVLHMWRCLSSKCEENLQSLCQQRITWLENDPDVSVTFDISSSIMEQFSKLHETIKQLSGALNEIEECSFKLDALYNLNVQSGDVVLNNLIQKVKCALGEIIPHLKMDLKCKRAIIEELGFARTKCMVIVCLTAWIHEPYFPKMMCTSLLQILQDVENKLSSRSSVLVVSISSVLGVCSSSCG